ncbi:unnamed protein product [Colias eurytheme]|nr:unnamed protein product [Colias eurytheme]
MTVMSLPPELADLTEVEQRLLSRVVPFIKIFNLQNRLSQSWCHGQVILFAQDDVEVAEQLPLPLSEAAQPPERTNSIPVPGLLRAANSSRRCMINNCRNVQLSHMPNSIKVYLLSYYSIFIPDRARICQSHVRNMTLDDLSQKIRTQEHGFNAAHFLDVIKIYKMALEQKSVLEMRYLNEISPEDLHFWTGLNHQQFNQLLNQTPSLRRASMSPNLD